jgi:hypothetical protein
MLTRRLFIDSRHASSGNSGNFTYPLAEQLVLPRESVCYITDVSCSHSWYTTETSKNASVYIVESQGGTDTARHLQLPEKSHDVLTLGQDLQTVLNSASKVVSGTYTVTYNPPRNTYTISVTGGSTFKYYSKRMFQNPALLGEFNTAGGTYILFAADNADELIGLRSENDYSSVSSLESEFLDVRHIHSLYIHSDSFTSYNSSGPGGSRSILCRIPVNTQFGDQIEWRHNGLPHDYVACGQISAATLQFSLRDGYNREVDLQGSHISFTLLFAEQPII